jgi:hypothetical protein
MHRCGRFGGVAAATPPNQLQRCILTDYFNNYNFSKRGPGRVVGIATHYGLDGPGIESRGGGGDFTHLYRPARRPPQPPVQWVPGLSRGKMRPGLEADPSPAS